MANIDGGHYFLTTLIPVKRDPVARADGSFTSPSHVLREMLAILPTAQQSPACVAAGFESPFSRCTRTHFIRAVVIDQPMYNGRDAGNSIVQSLANVDLLVHEPVDNLSCPYLMFCADFDVRADEDDGGFASWAEGLWSKMEPELRAVGASCVGFEHVVDGPSFCKWLKRCQIETTMSFNDYYVPMPDLHGYTLQALAVRLGIGWVALSALALWLLTVVAISPWWMLVAVPVAAVLAVVGVLWLLWIKGSKPFPAGADTDLPSILKALHVQQRFALLAADLQGADAATVHARFGAFLAEVKPDDTTEPTQKPGVIRSDGVRLVQHLTVTPKRVAL
jgi:hypothetical protein